MAGCCIGSEQQHAVWEACPQDAEPDELGAKCAAAITPELFEPAIKKVADELYCTLMESVQDWLCDNVEQNIASRIGNAERWARELRKELYDLDEVLGIGRCFMPRAGRVADLIRAERERDELLYAVAYKHEGETRHQTALRYIREREERSGDRAQVDTHPKGGDAVAAPFMGSAVGSESDDAPTLSPADPCSTPPPDGTGNMPSEHGEAS
jgi:hypothetical protein